jgi:ABC-type branched-subunit amino acid transport system ATPase component
VEQGVVSALSTRGLNKRFGSLVVAKDIAFDLPQGARHALIGPNGAGKTTLINLMTGMLQPDAGEILLGGENIAAGWCGHSRLIPCFPISMRSRP